MYLQGVVYFPHRRRLNQLKKPKQESRRVAATHWNPWTWMRVCVCQVAPSAPGQQEQVAAKRPTTARHRRRRGNKTGHNVVAKGGKCWVFAQLFHTSSQSFSTKSWVKCMRAEELWPKLKCRYLRENKQLTVIVTSCFFSRYLRLFILKRAGPCCQKFPLRNMFIKKTEY